MFVLLWMCPRLEDARERYGIARGRATPGLRKIVPFLRAYSGARLSLRKACLFLLRWPRGRRWRPRTMLTRMATMSTALRSVHPAADDLLGRVRELAFDLAREDGHTPLPFPDLCLYRFSAPRTFVKAATFGVTLGVVLQGAKRMRFGAHELAVDPTRLLVVTRDSEHESAVVGATRERPYLGLFLCFGPERVARALLALAEAGGTTARESVPAFLLDATSASPTRSNV